MNKKVRVTNKMQKGYVYEITALMGKEFDPEFKPDLTPKQMLSLGVFGGKYMRDCTKEYPEDWFAHAKFAKGDKKDISLNFFKIDASQPLSVWIKKGWINQEHDPRGWFEWYCRYYIGRRLPEEDKKQIKRWKAIRRHVGQIVHNCQPENTDCRPKQRQALLHWAYDSRKI